MNCGIQFLVLLGLCGVWIQQGYGLTCYSCNGGNSNNRCKRNTIECEDGQSCFASVQITGTGQVQSVRKQCVNRCATRRRRSCRSPGCSYCCSTDLCNGGLSTPSRIPEEDDTDTDNAVDRSNSVAFSARGTDATGSGDTSSIVRLTRVVTNIGNALDTDEMLARINVTLAVSDVGSNEVAPTQRTGRVRLTARERLQQQRASRRSSREQAQSRRARNRTVRQNRREQRLQRHREATGRGNDAIEERRNTVLDSAGETGNVEASQRADVMTMQRNPAVSSNQGGNQFSSDVDMSGNVIAAPTDMSDVALNMGGVVVRSNNGAVPVHDRTTLPTVAGMVQGTFTIMARNVESHSERMVVNVTQVLVNNGNLLQNDLKTAEYTVNVPGIYVFHVTSVAARSNTVATPLLLLKNDVAVLETGTFDGIASPSFHVGLGHVTLQLEMGDVIRLVTVPYGGLVLGSLSSPSEVTFTGFRLSSN